MKQTILCLFFTLIIASTLHAQQQKTKPFILGLTYNIHSTTLNETRTLNIYLPEGYSPDSAITYPIIYLLDGSANEDFVHIIGIVQFLTMIDAMPKSIVVGIANKDRKRDFTFPTTIVKDKTDYPTTGSSAKFITFIEKELQPFIRKHYKTNDTTTIIGQSLGGLLATEILLKKPGLFTNYIIVSPSLWWDNESLLLAAPKLLAQQSNRPVNIYISVGSEGEKMEQDAKQLSELLKTSGNKMMRIDFVPLPDENHLTILHNAAYKALITLFKKDQ